MTITVFTARSVRTMEPSMPTAKAVAVREGRIVEVGTLETLRPWLDAQDHEIDDTFRDHVIMPGFIDPHLHPSMAAILLPMHFTTVVEWDLPWSDIGAVRSQVEFLERLVRMLEGAGVAFMISGSVASSFHGEPRATRDVDLVIECSLDQLSALLDAVDREGWYVSRAAAKAALAERSMFNIIDPESAWKADLILRKARPFSAAEFERRITACLFGPDSIEVAVTTPEDTILSKLEWSRDTRTEQQYDDALAVAVLAGPRLDRAYLRRWASDLGVSDGLERLLAEADKLRGGS